MCLIRRTKGAYHDDDVDRCLDGVSDAFWSDNLGANAMILTHPVPVTDVMGMPPFLQNGGDAGVHLRAVDWSRHPFGPPDHWPALLQSMTSLVLRSQQPMLVTWGPDFLMIYNDGYAEICGDRHPAAEGMNIFDVWSGNPPIFNGVHP
jgi:hypothetical protein